VFSPTGIRLHEQLIILFMNESLTAVINVSLVKTPNDGGLYAKMIGRIKAEKYAMPTWAEKDLQ
jgi:hypothetical protein